MSHVLFGTFPFVLYKSQMQNKIYLLKGWKTEDQGIHSNSDLLTLTSDTCNWWFLGTLLIGDLSETFCAFQSNICLCLKRPVSILVLYGVVGNRWSKKTLLLDIEANAWCHSMSEKAKKKIIFLSISLSENCFQDYCSESTSHVPSTAPNMSPTSAHFILTITCEVDIIKWTTDSGDQAHRSYAAYVAWIHPYFNHKGVGLEQAQMGLHPTEAMQVDSTV